MDNPGRVLRRSFRHLLSSVTQSPIEGSRVTKYKRPHSCNDFVIGDVYEFNPDIVPSPLIFTIIFS